jgi:hypothetical protein
VIQSSAVDLTASPGAGIPTLKQNGLTTLDVSLMSTATTTNSVANHAWDFSGSGSNDVTCYSHSSIKASYQQAGLYLTQVTVRDTEGNQYKDTAIVNVLDISSTDATLKQIWNGMKSKLSAQDVEGAVSYICNNETRAKYRELFQQLLPYLPTIAANMRDISLDYVGPDVAEYRIKRSENVNGQMMDITYFIYFRRDENGAWLLDSF